MKTRRDLLRRVVRVGAGAFAALAFGSTHILARPRTRERAAMTLLDISQQMAAGKVTSRQVVERSLASIEDANGEGVRVFIRVHRDAALGQADRIDAQRRKGETLPALAGIPISIKDNFDEAGVTTLAGSKVLKGAPPGTRDATAVERLRAAGAVIIGRTNMTEFAYSGLGINPHYGTPKNVFDRAAARIPGGSSSGAAVSVGDGMAAAAIGTDTGGSVRIPAALNGLVGFKPTARRVPLDGVLPLSLTLDSAGPIARTVADCALLDQILSSAPVTELPTIAARGMRLAVPQTVVLDELSPAVAAAFASAITRLTAAGATVVDLPLRELARAAEVNPRGAISSAEAFWWHRPWIKEGADQYDPRVITRIRGGEAISAANYIELLQQRRRFASDVETVVRGFDALLMPALPDTAPTIAEVVASDESYFRFNGRMLRNPALVNLFDGCALTIPIHRQGEAPVGLMIAGTPGQDSHVLAVGLAIEKLLGAG
jgi:aspartyl-tRNA(Asn)/glutamyl-tRNA(Gln) amidotransferase subunit A